MGLGWGGGWLGHVDNTTKQADLSSGKARKSSIRHFIRQRQATGKTKGVQWELDLHIPSLYTQATNSHSMGLFSGGKIAKGQTEAVNLEQEDE